MPQCGVLVAAVITLLTGAEMQQERVGHVLLAVLVVAHQGHQRRWPIASRVCLHASRRHSQNSMVPHVLPTTAIRQQAVLRPLLGPSQAAAVLQGARALVALAYAAAMLS